ncbi:hypothetical protein O6H91_Y439200 [Diphasiastrum complanatum]|nr:hypothetical protein O6H91_Y439200 [Diphasiastrum complanatum]
MRKSRYQKTEKVKRCPEASFASSCVGSCRGDCTSCSGEAVQKRIEAIVDSQMDFTGVDSRAWVGEDAKPTERVSDMRKKLMLRQLSRKIVRNAKRGFWARRFTPLNSCITAVQQKLDHGLDKAHFQHVDSHFEDAFAVHNVPFSVATPPLFSECRNRSTGGKSSCDRIGPLGGSPGLDSGENNVKVGDFTDVVMEVVGREIYNKEQNTCSLQSNVKLDEFHGASSQAEMMNAKNSEITLKDLEVPMAFTTYVWEGHCDSQKESLGLLQQEKFQHQACILALPAFNRLPAHERRKIEGHKRISSLKKLLDINESHTQDVNKSPAYWKQQRIDTACPLKSGIEFAHCAPASRLRGRTPPSNYLLEGNNMHSSYQKAFDPPCAAVRPEKSGQNQNIEAASHRTVVAEDANTEEIIAMLLSLQEMGEKLNFMKDCLQLGMRKLFQKREKAIWNVTTNIQ